MCVILVTEKNFKPSLEILRACEYANPHGAGVAWRDGKRVRWVKGRHLTADDVHAILQKNEGPFVIHFRIASVGAICDELCHPFPVSGNVKLDTSGTAVSVLAHNGTWCDWERVVNSASRALQAKLPDGPFSDSRGAAWYVAQIGASAFDSMTGRFAHFGPKGIKLHGDWSKFNGYSASNTSWRYALRRHEDERQSTRFASRSLVSQAEFLLDGDE